jgi:hypothetical protein
VNELSLYNHITAIPVLRNPAHQQGHPVQVIRSSCHVATLQYTVRLRSELLVYLAPPCVVGWTQGEELVYLAPPGVVGWTQGEELVYLAPPGVVGWTQGEELVYLAPPGVVGWTQGEELVS